ncbi:MAG: T9SS type A sorting domain-containing protein, partial [Chloroherpetonaceae bacterium]|nr:T9SS type A sorting domain-containing protein [Chloroherpetonaceae bacterium]
SINSNGTIEYNGTGQTVTPRNSGLGNNYHILTFSGGNKTLGGNVDVGNALNLNGGIITTGANQIRVANNAVGAVTRTAGHINGTLVRALSTTTGNYLYPLGDASVYRRITLAANGSPNPAELAGRLIAGPGSSVSSNYQNPLQGVSQLRYYQFTNATGATSALVSQVIDMQVETDDGVGNASNTRVATHLQGDPEWTERGGSISGVPSLITSSGFSPVAIPTGLNFSVALGTTNVGDNPLPVELLSFTATSTAQGVKLVWETGSEHESNGFALLRRQHGEPTWTEVASYRTAPELRAQNSPNGASYSFLDKSRLEVGKTYEYQLTETGFDGTVTRFEPIALTVRFNVERAYELAQNYPNPFNPMTTIRYQIPEAGFVSLKVYDVLGKEVATLVNGVKEAGSHWVTFNAKGLASGVYFYRLQAGAFAETRKMMLVR